MLAWRYVSSFVWKTNTIVVDGIFVSGCSKKQIARSRTTIKPAFNRSKSVLAESRTTAQSIRIAKSVLPGSWVLLQNFGNGCRQGKERGQVGTQVGYSSSVERCDYTQKVLGYFQAQNNHFWIATIQITKQSTIQCLRMQSRWIYGYSDKLEAVNSTMIVTWQRITRWLLNLADHLLTIRCCHSILILLKLWNESQIWRFFSSAYARFWLMSVPNIGHSG